MALTARQVQLAKPGDKTITLTDGYGLQLVIFPHGRKGWRWRYYRPNGKRNMLSFGHYPEVSLAQAREQALDARRLVKQGIDPGEQRKQDQQEHAETQRNTLRLLAKEWHDNASKRWKATSKRAQLSWAVLELHVFPFLGDRPIEEIKPLEWLAVLKRLEEQGKHEQKRRVHFFCRDIYRLAIVTGRATNNPLSDLGVALERGPGKRSFAHVSQEEVPALYRAIHDYRGGLMVKYAMQLLFLTAARPGELRQAHWKEFDLEAAVWHVPAERMKMGRAHQVPLPRQALAVLEQLRAITGHYPLLFPGRNDPRKPISEMTLGMAFKRMGYAGRHVPHGTRHVIATGLKERGFPREWIELQLSHKLPGIEGVYVHAMHMSPEQRPRMMQEWADLLDSFIKT